MTQEHSRRGGVEPDTSERLYTADDLASYTAQRLHAESPPAPHGDPLTDPLDGAGRPVPEAPEPTPPEVAQPVESTPAPEPAPAPDPTPAEATPDPEVRRFMTATDFLERRADQVEPGPASWGWRGRVRRWTGGAVSPQMSRAEREHEQHRRYIQRDFAGPRTVAFLNPKGGAAKTTGVLVAGYTFGTVRGGGVVAWDNNETRGTLGIVRSQGDAHFDVLASDERPHVTGMIRAQDFTAVHELLERFYRLILIDTGNNMRAENWLAAAEAADLLVVTSTIREDTGYSGLWMLDALQDAGYENLKHKTVTVLSDPSSHVDEQLAHDLVQVYEQRTKSVYRVPYDPVLVPGSVLPYAQLSEGTRSRYARPALLGSARI
jgi:hypothetical protein